MRARNSACLRLYWDLNSLACASGRFLSLCITGFHLFLPLLLLLLLRFERLWVFIHFAAFFILYLYKVIFIPEQIESAVFNSNFSTKCVRMVFAPAAQMYICRSFILCTISKCTALIDVCLSVRKCVYSHAYDCCFYFLFVFFCAAWCI